jgi:hypothetical protein
MIPQILYAPWLMIVRIIWLEEETDRRAVCRSEHGSDSEPQTLELPEPSNPTYLLVSVASHTQNIHNSTNTNMYMVHVERIEKCNIG